ncbi:sensor histidine kinase [Streptomyces racemochromogenes]|uniref:sensor histidine kinase n=1 Tax=Streptomyces racemochromogenes TaxID=67353 RepID=UPI0035EA3837
MPWPPPASILVSVVRTPPIPRPVPGPPRGAPPSGWARTAAQAAGVALLGLGVFAAVAWAGLAPHPSFQLLVIAAAALLFPLRGRFPGPVLLALAVLTGLSGGAGPLAAVAAYGLARRTVRARRRARLPAAAAVLLVATATAAAPVVGPGPVPYGLALGLALAPTAVIVPGLVGTAQGQQQRLVRALRERGDAAERARLAADSEARTHERSRIAAEMHDLLGHRLSLISLHAGGLELALDRAAPELREEAVLVRRTTRDAMSELRQVLGVLGPLGRDAGPGVLTDATGTRADVEALVAESRGGGVAVRLDWTGPDLDGRPAAVRRAAHRVVREALTNVHRYAPSAHVTVGVAHEGEAVRITVRNGAPSGPPVPAGSLGTGRGLTGLRERVEVLGGSFEAAPLPSGGFLVDAVLPAEPGDAVVPHAAGPQGAGAALGAEGGGAEGGAANALTLALGLGALCVLMALATAFVYGSAPRPDSGPRPLPRVGMTYDEVTGLGVVDNKAVRAAATGHEPPRPAGTAGCAYPFNGATEVRPGGLLVARYCFDAGQRLIAVDRFTVPSVRDASPWETP